LSFCSHCAMRIRRRAPGGSTLADRKWPSARPDACNLHLSIPSKQGRRAMSSWLSEREQRLVAGAEAASAATPIPTQIVSNGEYLPPPQSAIQKKVETRIN